MNPTPPPIRPDRRLVERIITEEARRTGSAPYDVLNMGMTPEAKRARAEAIRRIAAESQCGAKEIAAVWGMDASTAFRALLAPGETMVAPLWHEADTSARLRWQYGDARAAQIMAGDDPNTQADIAAWNRLGAKGRAIA